MAHKMIIKGAYVRPNLIKKTIFKMIGNFSGNVLFKIPGKSPIPQISKDCLFGSPEPKAHNVSL